MFTSTLAKECCAVEVWTTLRICGAALPPWTEQAYAAGQLVFSKVSTLRRNIGVVDMNLYACSADTADEVMVSVRNEHDNHYCQVSSETLY